MHCECLNPPAPYPATLLDPTTNHASPPSPLLHVPSMAPHWPFTQVARGVPEKPVLHVAVQTDPDAVVAPQLNAPLLMMPGLPEHTANTHRNTNVAFGSNHEVAAMHSKNF